MARTSEQPNVIVFFTDQQRWDTTGVHGNPLDLTPNLIGWRGGEHMPTNRLPASRLWSSAVLLADGALRY